MRVECPSYKHLCELTRWTITGAIPRISVCWSVWHGSLAKTDRYRGCIVEQRLSAMEDCLVKVGCIRGKRDGDTLACTRFERYR
jgi:hypothetical protein